MPKKRWIILVVTLLVVGLVIAVVMSKSPKWLYQGVQSGIRRVGFSLVPYNLFNKEVKSGNYEVKGEVDGYEIKLVDQVALDIVSDRWGIFDIGGVIDPGKYKYIKFGVESTVTNNKASIVRLRFVLTDDVGENEFGRWGGDVNGKRQEVIVSGARLESDVLEIRLAFASGILKDVGYDKEFLTKWFSYAAVKTLYLLTPVAADHKHKLYLEAFEKAKGGEKVKVSELPSDVLLNPVDEFISLENNTDFKYPISVYRK